MNDGLKITEVSPINDPQETEHLEAGFYKPFGSLTRVSALINYRRLNGLGLERLCYLLLLAEGKVPRYFGKPGQKDYGIDLLVSCDDGHAVYQCKNEKSFSLSKMKKALQVFEKEWLGRSELPRPKQFVLCCPLPLDDRKQNEDWTILESAFSNRTGVVVKFWDRNYLDELLKKLPDVVADLFSDRAAERFCGLEDWNCDLFRPVMPGSGEKRSIDRYLELKANSRIYLDPKIADEDSEAGFPQKVNINRSVLIRGLPGTGKTITGLALAENLHHGRYRVFYVNMHYDMREDDLVKGVKRRLTRPTIFLLDDCHGKYDMLERVLNRLSVLPDMQSKGLLVFTARTTPTPEGMPRGDFSSFEESLDENNGIIDLKCTPSTFAQIMDITKPEFAGLSKERLQKVFEFTGHDLFLLDQLIETLNSPTEIDELKPEVLFEEALVRYFGSPTVYRPLFMNLVALAQFDLAPRVASFGFNLEEEDEKAASQLVVLAGRPPRYFFLHSSAAELVFRALAWNAKEVNYRKQAVDYLIDFFKRHGSNEERLADDLASVIVNRLKLTDEDEEYLLKTSFLSNDSIYSLIEKNFERLPLKLFPKCLDILNHTNIEAHQCYCKLVEKEIECGRVLKMAIKSPFWQVGPFLESAKSNPSWLASLQNQLVGQKLRSAVRKSEFQNIILLLANLSDPDDVRWEASLDLTTDEDLDAMIRRTIASGRAIGTIGIVRVELYKNNPPLLEKLEHKIGVERYLRLIGSAGTIFELLNMIRWLSTFMAEELIEYLDDKMLDGLVHKTIVSGRSIGTISLVLRKLGRNNPPLLEKLEQKIGSERSLRLICSSGTIYELFMTIQYSSSSMSEELIEELDDKMVDGLVDKTIASGRSIGTIHLALRELGRNNPVLLKRLEYKIGVRNMWQLICANGHIGVLAQILSCSSKSFRWELESRSLEASIDDWKTLVLCGNFKDLCVFVRMCGCFFSRRFTPTFLNSIEPIFNKLVQSSRWESLTQRLSLLRAAPDSTIKQILLDLLYDYAGSINFDALNFESLKEGCSCIRFLWDQLPLKRQELLDLLPAMLPEESKWYSSESFLRSIRAICFVMSDPLAQRDYASRVLSIGNNEKVASLCTKCTLLDLFLYLWNLYSLWFQWEKAGEETFADFLHPAISNATTGALLKRFQKKSTKDLDNLIALSGFVSFAGLTFEPEEKVEWASILPSFDNLQKRARSKTFVPAVFFLLGLEWVFEKENASSPKMWQYILPKAEEYSEKRTAVVDLCTYMRARID